MPRRRLFLLAGLLLVQSCEAYLPTRPPATNELPTPSLPPDPLSPTPAPQPVDAGPPPEFDPLPLRVGVTKAKDLLTGLHVTQEEMSSASTPAGFKELVDRWTSTSEFEQTMLRFFIDAFQQGPIEESDFTSIGLVSERPNDYAYWPLPKLRMSLQEMFARTAIGIVQEGRPFTEVATTTRFKLNVPLKSVLTFLDAHPRRDDYQFSQDSWLWSAFPNFRYEVTKQSIPRTQTLDATHPNFMRWTQQCTLAGEFTTPGPLGVENAFKSLFGQWVGQDCGGSDGSDMFSPADYIDWQWVNVRTARPPEWPTYFWDLPKLRAATEIVVETPRVGFFTTPAFFARFPTNTTNSFRATANQALIVGLGKTMNSPTAIPSVQDDPNDSAHLRPGSSCIGCHQILDPMRDFFRQDYSITSSPRPKTGPVAGSPILAQATFQIDGHPAVRGRGVTALGRAIAEHPDFAAAWAQKLCLWANATPCVEDDPEFIRVVDAFRGSNHNFKVLLRELLTSPLVTFQSRTQTSDENGVSVSVANRQVFCQRIAARTKLPDICLQNYLKHTFDRTPPLQGKSVGIPAMMQSRGEALAVVPTKPGVLFQPAVDSLCRALVTDATDRGYAQNLVGESVFRRDMLWPTSFAEGSPELERSIDKAMGDFVELFLNVRKGEESYDELRTALREYYDEVLPLVQGVPHQGRASFALKEVFIVACSSPQNASIGL